MFIIAELDPMKQKDDRLMIYTRRPDFEQETKK